jgi:hypothetical protein
MAGVLSDGWRLGKLPAVAEIGVAGFPKLIYSTPHFSTASPPPHAVITKNEKRRRMK